MGAVFSLIILGENEKALEGCELAFYTERRFNVRQYSTCLDPNRIEKKESVQEENKEGSPLLAAEYLDFLKTDTQSRQTPNEQELSYRIGGVQWGHIEGNSPIAREEGAKLLLD